MAVRRIAHERLRHERRDQAVLARDDPADLPVGEEVVGIRERRVRGLVDLDLRPVLRVRVRDPEPHPAAVLEQVEHDRLELLEVGDLVERPGVGRVLELAGLLASQPHELRLDADEHVRARLPAKRLLVAGDRAAAVVIEELARLEVVVEAVDARELRPPWQPSQGAEIGDHRAFCILLAERDRIPPDGRPEVAHGERVHPDPPAGDALEEVLRDELPDGAAVDRRRDEVDGLDALGLDEFHRRVDVGGERVRAGPLVVVRDRVVRGGHGHPPRRRRGDEAISYRSRVVVSRGIRGQRYGSSFLTSARI